MKTTLGRLRGFLTAEEVPRWFGLSVVLIYLVGLTAIGQFAIAQLRADGAARFQRHCEYSAKLLGHRISAIDGWRPGAPEWENAVARYLREFALNVPVIAVRIVNEDTQRIVASTNPSEVGSAAANPTGAAARSTAFESIRTDSSSDGEPRLMIRVPLAARTNVDGVAASGEGTKPKTRGEGPATGSSRGEYRLEVSAPQTPPVQSHWIGRATTLGVVLVVLGALFVVYRCLREQLRGVSQIAHRLEAHGERLEAGIQSLRIGDGCDAITASWNKLVDFTDELLRSSRQQQADEELFRVLQRSSGGALAEALHAVPDGIILVVDEKRIEYMNSTASRLLGWTGQNGEKPAVTDVSSEVVGAKLLGIIREALLPDGQFDARVELIETGDVQGRDQSCYRVWLIPLQRGRRSGECIVIVRDVSQQVRAERAREEFIAQVTHEFRTPLTNIRAYTETLSSGMFEDPQTISECYNVITKETRRLSRLIEDILSVSQLEIGSIELKLDSVDLRALLAEGVRDVRGLADEKNIDVQIALPAKLEPIRADRDKLAVVINNLLGNAIKYTAAGGNVIVGCQASPDTVTITVKDNGMGIAPQDQARVFEKFQRGSDPEVQKITGTGIGLFTAREIVRRHGGDIELISEKGVGSTFLVRLPHKESRASALSTAQAGGVHG